MNKIMYGIVFSEHVLFIETYTLFVDLSCTQINE